jgi:protein-L-isoaspartate(D-aspartate) O-methyltransferase
MTIQIQRANMVRNQVRPIGVTDSNVTGAMLKVPRHHFVAEKFAAVAYSDAELPMFNGDNKKLIARPEMIAKLLAIAEITNQDRVLEIGCGTGYATAIISEIAQHVTGIDSNKKAISKAQKIIKDLEIQNITFHQQDLTQPFDVSDFNIIIINGAIFSRDPGDISHIQDTNDLFDIRSRNMLNNLLETFDHKIITVEGYYRYAPMNLVKYHHGQREILDEIYMPEISL